MASVLRQTDTDMTSGGIVRQLIVFAMPLLIGNIFQQLYNTVDSVVVGNYVGKEALAAVGSVAPIINMLIGLFSGLAAGAGVVISQYYGAHDDRRVHDAVHTTMALTLVLCVVLSVIGVWIVPATLRMMDTPEDVFAMASEYLTIYFEGLAGLLLYNIGAGILRAVGDSRRPLYFLIFSALTNTGLDLLFVTQFHMGVAGVAIATVVAQVLSAILVLVVLTASRSSYRIIWRDVRFDGRMLRQTCRIGMPSAIQMAVTSFSNIFVQAYINRFGSACMAGWTSYGKIDAFALLPMMTVSMAATTFVGQNLGAGNEERAHSGTKWSLRLAIGITAVILVPVMVFAPQMIGAFNREPEVLHYGTLFVRVISPFYLLCAVNQVLAGSLRGAGDTKIPMYIMLGSFVVFRQIYLIVTYRLFGTILPVALGYPVGWVLCSILILIYYRRGNWVRHGVVDART
ncbi:MAG: MATE family efflux transporter [Oscillospiraceae bacterium]|nr:MATE family efflux transporter [Oscillospiraceae bacterium]